MFFSGPTIKSQHKGQTRECPNKISCHGAGPAGLSLSAALSSTALLTTIMLTTDTSMMTRLSKSSHRILRRRYDHRPFLRHFALVCSFMCVEYSSTTGSQLLRKERSTYLKSANGAKPRTRNRLYISRGGRRIYLWPFPVDLRSFCI